LIERFENEAGYSIVEVMAAIMILAIAIIPMASMFDAGLRAALVGANYDRGRAIASQELEGIRALPFRGDSGSVVSTYPPGSPTACTGPSPAGFDCEVETTYVRVGTAEVLADPDAQNMMQVRVTVSWQGGSSSYTTTGLISRETRCADGC